jgi:hypothetical protein
VHAFVGGNTWIPGVIKGEYGPGLEQSGTHRIESLDQTIAWARDMLGTAASLDTTIQTYTPPTAQTAGSMALQVKVTNLSGHKLPTGYSEGRRMWLNVQVRDANGALVFESGAYDPVAAALTQDAQARVYEVLQGIWNEHGTGACDIADAGGARVFHFVLNDCIAKDSRIPPLGFTPATASDPNGYDLQPVAFDYPETSPGSGVLVNFDSAPYALTIPAGTIGPLTATARLYYQTSSDDYIRSEGPTTAAGNAQAANTAMQMVDPWKYGVQNTRLLVPAQRSEAAVNAADQAAGAKAVQPTSTTD